MILKLPFWEVCGGPLIAPRPSALTPPMAAMEEVTPLGRLSVQLGGAAVKSSLRLSHAMDRGEGSRGGGG